MSTVHTPLGAAHFPKRENMCAFGAVKNVRMSSSAERTGYALCGGNEQQK
jgi:hypothetical protein